MKAIGMVVASAAVLFLTVGCGSKHSPEEVCEHITDLTMGDLGTSMPEARTQAIEACVESAEEQPREFRRSSNCIMKAESTAELMECR